MPIPPDHEFNQVVQECKRDARHFDACMSSQGWEIATAQQQAEYDAAKARIDQEVNAFASDPAHPYFDEVADEVVRLTHTGMSLQEAYDQASKNCTSQKIGTQIVKKCP